MDPEELAKILAEAESAPQPPERKDEHEEDEAPSFPISATLARGLRTGGNIMLGLGVALLIVWWITPQELHVMLVTTVVFSTIGVMCHILGWLAGVAHWLFERFKVELAKHERRRKADMEKLEAQRIIRGRALLDSLDDVRHQIVELRADSEIDRGRVIALVEQHDAKLTAVLEELRRGHDERAELRGDVIELAAVCRPQPQQRRKKPPAKPPQPQHDAKYLADMAESVELGKTLERRRQEPPLATV